MIAWLLWLGFSEATAINIVTSKWLKRALTVIVTAALLLFAMWYLTHLGGQWREDAIRRAWAAKFASVTLEQQRLALARQRHFMSVSEAVDDALKKYKAELDEHPPVVVSVIKGKCAIDVPSVKRLNKIVR